MRSWYKNFATALLSFFMLLSVFALGQKDSTHHKKRLHFKIFYCPAYSSILKKTAQPITSTVLSKTGGGGDYGVYSYKTSNVTGSYALAYGLLIDINLSRHLFLSTGFSFEKVAYKTKANTPFSVYLWGDMSFPRSYQTNNLQIAYTYKYISFPLTVNYTFKRKELRYSFGLGASYNLLSKVYVVQTPGTQYGQQQSTFDYQRSVDGKASNRCSAILDIAVGYEINQKREIGLAPHLQYYFPNNSLSDNIRWTGYNGAAGFISTGCRIFFKF